MKLSFVSLIRKLVMLGFVGILISACTNTMEGMGKDLQTMGGAIGGSGASTKQQNQSQTQGKDVVVTPVK
ncbi:hypothetical protein [Polynucleobacter necessarius]|uniref:hypothetical protein n=1 Tax=Polynucleobacter necessarius TaxID=576610 RepID=UPI000E097BFC|nr:hypothetical protein [Polynucleobacter necessarius]